MTATDLPILAFTREPWQQTAACRGLDPALFFPDHRSGRNPNSNARDTCAACPVTAECLDYALRTGQAYGVWGGTSVRDRRRLRYGTRTAEVVS